MDTTTARTVYPDDIIIPSPFVKYECRSRLSFSPNMPDDPHHLCFEPKRFRKRQIWLLLAAIAASTLAVIMCMVYIAYSHDELASLEFFLLVALPN
ncbi:hypothetical protein RvY_11975 [Ramazzottius varieornatus]|uniref:Uncharacterized protein n=1 Tax=Ramazzottius varieornatus TaxID=947166 RepID=A0A1D1VQL4_RAMVA|nr:hypothetical protein RvY_11975 [Ramazzottius varieornatus]